MAHTAVCSQLIIIINNLMKKDSTLELYIMRYCVPRQEIFKWGQVKTEIHLPTKEVDLIFSALVLINEYDATKVKQVLNGQLHGIYYILPMGEL